MPNGTVEFQNLFVSPHGGGMEINMIIDSHAHYAHARFDVEIPYLRAQNGEYTVCRADREGLLAEMRKHHIVGFIEPSIGFDSIEKQLTLVSEHRAFMWAALGVHPTRCIHTAWENRQKVKEYAENNNIIAIGETGLDYHYPREKQHRLRQKRWFVYQLKLADRLRLPLVLHIRMADKDALKILKKYKTRLHGGVVHCFTGDHRLAEEYIALGFTIGIGGKLLCDDAEGHALRDTVAHVPSDALLVETDAPYVLPDIDELICSGHQRKKLCNSSLILPMVIRRIAELRGEDPEAIEDTIYRNTVRVFKLSVDGDDAHP